MKKIDRRKAIKQASLILGGTLCHSLILGVLNGCEANVDVNWLPSALSDDQMSLIAEMAEVIIPTTDTPGAKAAKVDRFIHEMYLAYMTQKEQKLLLKGLELLEEKDFGTIDTEAKYGIVSHLANDMPIAKGQGKSFFRLMKELTMLGYFTSEIGAKLALNFDPVPGQYEGCIPIQKYGGKTWAISS